MLPFNPLNLELFELDDYGYSLSCDPVCAFALHHPNFVQWEQLAVQVDKSTGLLALATSDADQQQTSTIRVASDLDLSQYLQWVHTAMDPSKTSDTN